MKRALTSSASKGSSKAKKPRIEIPAYHTTPQVKGSDGTFIWPAPLSDMTLARNLIRECASSRERTLIIPDKDADGLTSGAILRKTLLLLGHDQQQIQVHLLSKSHNVQSSNEREAMATTNPKYIFVLDQGSMAGPPLIDAPHKSLIIDHHNATDNDFPEGSLHVNACHFPPVATSSLLTYLICEPLHNDVIQKCDWLAIIGTHGDLGNTLKWEPPFPDMKDALKRYSKKLLNDAVSALNAPRRTASFDVVTAWDALIKASEAEDTLESLKNLVKNPRLVDARAEISQEIERCTHTPPKFSHDGRVAVLRITSPCQVHPIIATRWAGHLKSNKLEVILVANDGYSEGMVNFSCRIPKAAKINDPPINIIATLEGYAAQGENGLRERLGVSFARGHKEASGGIVPTEEFEELMNVMRVGEKIEKVRNQSDKKKGQTKAQKNTLMNYFGSK